MSQDDLPEGWHESTVDQNAAERYDPRPPILYEADDEVCVQVVPAGANGPHGDEDRWRVALLEGTSLSPERVEAATEVEGRDDAMALARDLMAAYNEQGSVEDARHAI
ncbi:hypothetical protein [Halomarina ordinaria]|uniref:Type II toxin-antitoxin system HicB family antitoxin n=1 Tax=Halomarina ordinaria TaxID=3033939 RepID=A0ABD5U4K7_9EURY|nr:hypothetical protein [Halomarina sp. PSRA2]